MKKLSKSDLDRITSKGGIVERKPVLAKEKQVAKQELSPDIAKEVRKAATEIVGSLNDFNSENTMLFIQMYEKLSTLMLKVIDKLEEPKIIYPQRDFVFDIERNTNGFIRSVKVKEEEVTKH